ncbi:nucleotide-diphospho-sugar transferase [Sphaerosporella brunnea]|uniref:Mannose-1-phosphate guanyltransferase n=1 Tax=Sphaerosporella brunnea TaxID=1250544 RepID=A0A5J5ELI8_9PEZI|nr:nucleotide-diphospho-sugar transferase [Sphaerosporella brunnea]
MSSKKNKPAGGNKKREEEQRENILQAVVLTDSYQTRFRPFTLETPRCLLPLANVPLIDYTLEFLSLAGVEDVFIFASTHAEKIEEYIRNSKWNKPSSPFTKCQIVMSPSSLSVGDAMRELDGKGMITTDFLLVNGDFVSNIPLEEVLRAHRDRRTKDKNSIMTMILREAGYGHRTKARGESGVFVIDEATQRCVHYEEMRHSGDSKVLLPPELIKHHPQLRIRTDLIDCQVDICSPDVPALFTENFDYQHIRRHFLHGILTDYELYGKMIHTHVLSEGYAARVRSLQTYDAVSRDIISRWTYPMVPDNNLGPNQSYSLERGNIYKEEDVVLARSCTVKRNTILGVGTLIGAGSIVGNSIIGAGCKIGQNVVLEGVYVWDNVVIEDGCKIQNSIIASDCVLGKDSFIGEGSVISYGVKIADGAQISPFSRITANRRRKDRTAEDHEEAVSGSDYEDSESESEDEHAAAIQDGLVYSTHHLNLSFSSISTLPGEDSDEDDMSGTIPRKTKTGRSDSTTSFESVDESWHREAFTSLLNAMENDHPAEVANLELNGLRMTANANFHQVRRAVAAALVTRIEQVVAKDGLTNAAASAKVLQRWESTIKRCIFERKDQAEFLLLMQRECSDRKAGPSLLLYIVQVLNNTMEMVEEEAVNNWWLDVKSFEDEKMAAVRKPTEAFVKWLAEAESESETEEEEEDDDDDE